MSKMRSVNTKLWTDPYIADLTVKETYLFLYLLTNIHTNMAGVYEIGLRQIAFECKLVPDEINTILKKLRQDEKVYYEKGWVIIVNFIKNQSLNPSIKKGIENDLETLPEWLKKWVKPVQIKNQLVLEIVQPDDSLGTASPQTHRQAATKEANLIEANLIKLKGKQDSKFHYGEKTPEAQDSKGDGYEKFKKAREKLKGAGL